MGTEVSVVAAGAESVDAVRDIFAWIEAICSRFLPTSELSRINRHGRRAMSVSPVMAGVLSCAAELRSRTSGLVDPAVGAQLKDWGYDRSFESVIALEQAPVVASAGDWKIDDRVLTIEPKVQLDLGGIAKGWACDVAVATTGARVVNAGGDMRSLDDNLTVAVTDPYGEVMARVLVGSGALATSTTAHRAWRVGSGWANHLIDPRTGRPTDGPVVTASAIAATAAEAEAAAKAVLLLGEEGLAWASRQSWIRGAIVLWMDGCIYGTSGVEYAA